MKVEAIRAEKPEPPRLTDARAQRFVELGQKAALIFCKKAEELSALDFYGQTRRRKPGGLPEITQKEVIKWVISVSHEISTRHRKVNRHATAFSRGNKIRYNHLYLAQIPEEEFDSRVMDLILHEMGHLFTWHFLGTMYHDYDWQIIGCTVGYAPVGSTSERNRSSLIRAVAHAQEVEG